MKHLLNVFWNWFMFWSPVVSTGGIILGLVWGACYMLDHYVY